MAENVASNAFAVLARLTNCSAEAAAKAEEVWAHDPDLRALVYLFPTDPLITSDYYSFVISSSTIDAAYHAGSQGTDLLRVIEEVVAKINGTASLLLDSYMCPARATGQVTTPTHVSAQAEFARYWAHKPRDYSQLDSASSTVVLQAVARDPLLQEVVMLLGSPKPGFVWFDYWRVWEAIRRHASDIGQAFDDWLDDPQARLDFERSANDPAVSGAFARHGQWTPLKKAADSQGRPLGRPMTTSDAQRLITALVRRWIEESAKVTLLVEQP